MRSERAPLHLGWFTLVAVAFGPLVGPVALMIGMGNWEAFGGGKEMLQAFALFYGVGVPCALVLCGALWLERRYFGRNSFWRMVGFTLIVIPVIYACFVFAFELRGRGRTDILDWKMLRGIFLLIGIPSLAAGCFAWGGARLLQRLMPNSRASSE